jgi:hypothetical protein
VPFFLSRSLLVQRNKTDEDVVVAEAGRPAISFGNGGIEFSAAGAVPARSFCKTL